MVYGATLTFEGNMRGISSIVAHETQEILFTGGKDKDLIKLLEPVNVKIGSTISKNTFAIIAKSKDEESSKLVKARNMNIPIFELDEFKEKYFEN